MKTNPLEVMAEFANAVLALRAAIENNDDVAGIAATVAIVHAWDVYNGDAHVITAAVEALAMSVEELEIKI